MTNPWTSADASQNDKTETELPSAQSAISGFISDALTPKQVALVSKNGKNPDLDALAVDVDQDDRDPSTVSADRNGYAGVPTEPSLEAYEPMDWKSARILYLIAAADAAVGLVIAPYLPQFCTDVLHISKEHLGPSVGLVSTAYSLANGISNPYIGDLSDRYGRKPLLFMGLLTSFVSILAFPFGTHLWHIIVIRSFTGFFNGNLTVSRAYLSDLATNVFPADRTVAFSMIGAAWGVSRFLASAIAGLTLGTPVFGNTYMLPSIFVAALVWLTAVLLYFVNPIPDPAQFEARTESGISNQSGLGMDMKQTTFWQRLAILREQGKYPLMMLILAYSLHSFSNGALLVVMALYWNQKMHLDRIQASYNFAVFGFVGLAFQLTLFPKLAHWLQSSRMIYSIGAIMLSIGCMCILLGARIRELQDPNWERLAMFLSLIPSSIGFQLSLPVITALISLTIPKEIQGIGQGTSSLFAAIARSIAPVLAGIAYSFNTYLPFCILSVNYLLCFMIAHHLKGMLIEDSPGH